MPIKELLELRMGLVANTGLIGTIAGIGASAGISNLLQNAGSNVSFELNLGIILGGIGTGCVTALIFGVLPIVKAANIRPLQVLRQVETGSWSGRILTMGLLGLFSILFCGLATVILNNDLVMGIVVTYTTFAFLLLISAFFSLIVFAISKLPVPERLNLISFGLVMPGLAFSWLVYQIVPVFGIFLLAVSVLGLVVPFLPEPGKSI